jgi:hypothetical protein
VRRVLRAADLTAPGARAPVPQVKRCDELARKVRFFHDQVRANGDHRGRCKQQEQQEQEGGLEQGWSGAGVALPLQSSRSSRPSALRCSRRRPRAAAHRDRQTRPSPRAPRWRRRAWPSASARCQTRSTTWTSWRWGDPPRGGTRATRVCAACAPVPQSPLASNTPDHRSGPSLANPLKPGDS